MTTTKKTLLSIGLLAVLGWSAVSQADVVTNIDLTVPIGAGGADVTFSGIDSIDWNQNGSGLAIGIGPFDDSVLIPVSTPFQFLYQANAVLLSGPGLADSPNEMDTSSNGSWGSKTFELTIVANLYEVVESSSFSKPGNLDPSVTLIPDPSKNSTISIFYDAPELSGGGLSSRTSDGTGFADGLEIARFNIGAGPNGFQSKTVFTAITGSDTGQGSPKIYADLSGAGAFVNTDYLTGITGLIFDLEFQSTINFPPSTSTTTAFFAGGSAPYSPYTVDSDCQTGTCDILFKVDGSNQFTTKVPEPTSLLLLAGGLFGLGWTTRRRSA